MFKNKRIVAMVLCALMLFVPVAAMAADPYNGDLLRAYRNVVDDATTESSSLAGLANAYKAALLNLAKNPSEANKDAADEALKNFNKQVEKANEAIAVAENAKYAVDGSSINGANGYEAFRKDNNDGPIDVSNFWCSDKATAKKWYEWSNDRVADAKKAVKEAEEVISKLDDVDKIAQEALERALKMAADAKTLEEAEAALDLVTGVYDGMNKAYKDIAAPYVQKVWDRYASFATFYQKNAKFRTLSKDVQKVLGDINTKYEMMSTGVEGWILEDTAKNGCLKDVAEFKVEKKDGKFVAKVYDANGKEIVLKQQLTVYRPIAKDVKVLSAKVDGKTVTFSVGLRGNQNYVSVPVVF